MQRALAVPEIVHMIFTAVRPFSDRRDDDSLYTLAVLARTCTTFRDPALDVLWRSATIPRVLIYATAQDLWEKKEEDDEHPQVRLLPRRAMVPEDWERTPFFSNRIRVLRLRGVTRPPIDFSEVYATAALCPPPRSIFPNVHTVDWERSEHLCHFRAFLGPAITYISFGAFLAGSQLSLLPYIAREYPKLKGLSIASDPAHHLERQVHAISTLVCNLHELESLAVHHLDVPAQEHIGRLSNLKSLNLHNITAALNSSPPKSLEPLFPVLQALTLAYDDIASVTAFLGICSESPLRSLNVGFKGCPDAGEMQQLFATLVEHRSCAVIQHLTTHIPWLIAAPDNAGLYSIHPLFSLRHITHVKIVSPMGFDLDDNGVSALARAWSSLEELQLSSVDSPPDPRVTLASLDTLARHCPHLHNLVIPFDATVVPPLDDSPERRILHERLLSISVGNFPISVPMDVAKYLSAVFPHVSVFPSEPDQWDDIWDDVHSERNQRWKEVQRVVPEFQEIRRQERRWARHGAI
ncbi:hypothetical protein MVEN_01979000 [Mycena venus]|uniref:F-box domain-containing protein n=1 Tax=Mycena venus TaxID=2733690 RepID=A0A8H7CKU4_9AGAR|nr:hypothetical protein MVEN_01979000 [Mycena venus]